MKPITTEARKARPVNAATEDAYWRDHHRNRPYTAGESYDIWQAAFRYGWEAYDRNRGKKFEEVEIALRLEWDNLNTPKGMNWHKAMHATRDAWYRLEHANR